MTRQRQYLCTELLRACSQLVALRDQPGDPRGEALATLAVLDECESVMRAGVADARPSKRHVPRRPPRGQVVLGLLDTPSGLGDPLLQPLAVTAHLAVLAGGIVERRQLGIRQCQQAAQRGVRIRFVSGIREDPPQQPTVLIDHSGQFRRVSLLFSGGVRVLAGLGQAGEHFSAFVDLGQCR
jgi:hypothetical protein